MSGRLSKAISILLTCAVIITSLPVNAYGKDLQPAQSPEANTGAAYQPAHAYFFVNNSATTTLTATEDGSVTFDLSVSSEGEGSGFPVEITMVVKDYVFPGDGTTPPGYYQLLRSPDAYYGAAWSESDPGCLKNVRIPDVKPGEYEVVIYTSTGNYYRVENAVTIHAAGSITPKPESGHAIRFFLNGGTGIPDEDYGTRSIDAGSIITLPAAPSRPGHSFAGWKSAGTLYRAGAQYTVREDTDFTADWGVMGDVIIRFPAEITRVVGYLWMTGTYRDASGTERVERLWQKDYPEIATPDNITLNQWKIYDRSYTGLKVLTYVDGAETVIAEYDGTEDPVTDSSDSVQLIATDDSYLPVTGLEVTGLESGRDYFVQRIGGKEGNNISLPCMTASGEGFQAELRGCSSSSAYERYYWEEPYPAKLSGDRLVVTPLEIADAVEVTVSLTDSGEAAGWKTVTVTQEAGGISRTVNGYAEGDGKAKLNLLPGYEARFLVNGCYIKSGEMLPGDGITAGAEHTLDIGEAFLTARIELTTQSEEDTVSRYLEGLTGSYAADGNAALEIGSGNVSDRTDIRMSGKKSSGTVRLYQTATFASFPVTLSGYAVVSPDPQTVELKDGSIAVSFQAALRPGVLVNLSGDTRGSYYLAWYDGTGAFAGKTDISLSLGSPHDFGILGPVDENGESLTGEFTLVLIPASYEPLISESSLLAFPEGMDMTRWQVTLQDNVITTLEARRVGAAEGKNALYITQPASALSCAEDSFADTRELVTFAGSIRLDGGIEDGKLNVLEVDTGGSRVSATANVRSLVIGGEVFEPTSSHASFGKTEYVFSEPVDLPCNFTLYCEPESVEEDMEVSVTSTVECSMGGIRQVKERQLVGETTVARPGVGLYTPSTYVCSEQVKLSGTAGAYEDVTIFDNDVPIGTAKGDKHGDWMALVPLYRADTGETKLSTTHGLYTMSASGTRSRTLTVFHQADGPELKSLTMEWGDAGERRKINIGESYSGYSNMKDVTITAGFENPDALDTMPGWDSPVVFKIYSWNDITMREGDRVTDGSYSVSLGDMDGGDVMQVNVLYLPKLRYGTSELEEGKNYRLTATLQDEQDMAEMLDAMPLESMPSSGSYYIDFSGDEPDLSKALPEGLDLPFSEDDLARLQKNFADAGVNLKSYLAKFGDDTKDADDLPAWISGLSTLRCENAAWYTRTVQFRSDDADIFQAQRSAIATMADEHTEVIYPGNTCHADRYVFSDAVTGFDEDYPYEPGVESMTWCVVADFLSAPADGLYAANVNVLLNGSGFQGFKGREFDQSGSVKPLTARGDESDETVRDVTEDGETVSGDMAEDELTALLAGSYNGKFTESLTYDGNCNIESGTGIVSGSLGTITPYMQAANMSGGTQLGLLGTGLTVWNTYMTIENKNHRRDTAWKLRDELLDLRYLSPCARKIMENDPELAELMRNCIDEYDKVYKKFRCTDDYITYTSVLGNVTATVLGVVPTPVTQLGSVGVSGLTTGFSLFTSQFVSEGYENLIKSYERQHETLRRIFRRYAQKHSDDPNAKDCLEGNDGDGREAWVSWDPSGIVYEGVKENPVANASVTLYMAVDPDGDAVTAGKEESVSSLLTPEGVPGVIPQETTLITGEDGYYEWLVPKGLWFVTAQRGGLCGDSNADRAATSAIADTQAGSRTATRLLPVLPPQLDVNIPLIDSSAPLVEEVEYTGEGIRVTWNKYMKEGSGAASVLDKTNYMVFTAQDETLAIESVTPVLQGHAPSNIDQSETTYTRTVILKMSDELPKGVPLTLIISGSVESYASSTMGSDYTGAGSVGYTEDHGKGFRIEGLRSSYEYTGFPITPEISIYDSGILLKKGKDYQISYRNNTKANDAASLIIKGKGNYTGPVVKGFAITKASLSADNAAVSAFYTTKGSKRRVLVYYNGQKLKEKRDYTVSPDGMKITGIGNFQDERTVTEAAFPLLAIGKTTISLPKSMDYAGEEITPVLSVKTKQGETLTVGTHYKVLCTGNRDAGTATVRIIGLESAGYTGVVKKTFRIRPVSLRSEKISVRVEATAKYAKGGAKPGITIVYDNGDHIKRTLREGTDYTVRYMNNANAGLAEKPGLATLTLKGIGNYMDTVSENFTVTKTSIASLKLSVGSKQYKAGKKVSYYVGTPVIYDTSGKRLSAGKDFTIRYYTGSDNREIKKTDIVTGEMDSIMLIIKGEGGFDGDASATCEITKNDQTQIGNAVIMKLTTQSYTGGAITPEVTLREKEGDALKLHTDYEILGYYNNVNRGNAFVFVRGLGSYTGSMVISFKIGPAKIKIP